MNDGVMKRFFRLEAYTNPVERQWASNLYWLLYVLGGIFVVMNLGILASGELSTLILACDALLVISFGVCWWLNRSGYEGWSAMLLLAVLLGINLVISWDGGEVGLFAAFGIWLLLIMSSLILPTDRIVYLGGLVLVGVGGLFIAGVEIQSASGEANNSYVYSALFLAITGFLAFISWLVSQNFGSIQAATQLVETRRNLLLQETTSIVSQQIAMQLDLEILLKETVELIRRSFEDIYHAQVFLIDSTGKLAELRASTGTVGEALLAKKHALAVGSMSVIGKVTSQGDFVLVSDTSADPVHRVNELLPNTRTELAIPLKIRGMIIGALDVQSTTPNVFTSNDVGILQNLGNQIAVAVENARLYTAAQDEAKRAKALAEASQITSQLSLDFDKGLATLFETITTPGQYTHWWFGVVHPNEMTLRCVTSHKSLVTSLLLPFEINLATEKNSLVDAYRTKRSLIINDLTNAPSFREVSDATYAMFGKHIAAPLFAPDSREVVGVLLVGRDRSAPDLGSRDLELVSTMTSQLSIALQNRNLFHQLEREQKRLQQVLNTMPVTVLVVNHEGRILLANEQAQSVLGAAIKTGANIDDSYPIYRTGTDERYPRHERPFALALKHGGIFSAEDLAIMHPDGSQVDVLAKAAPLQDEDGRVQSVVVVYQDITELRELERALQESLSETTKLYEASRAISHAQDLNAIAESVINQMLVLSPDMVYMTLRNPNAQDDPDEIRLLVSWPHERPHHISELGIPRSILIPNARLGTTNLTFATRNLQTLPGVSQTELDQLRRKGINAIAILPLEARGEIFGAIIAAFKEDRLFAPEERRFLLTLADQTSVAVDAMLSFQSTQDTLRSISRMYQASRAIASESDIDTAISVIQSQLLALNPDRLNISLARDQEGLGRLDQVLDWSEDDDYQDIVLVSEEDTLFDMLSRDEFFIEDVDTDDDPMAQLYHGQNSVYQAIASLPFRAAGQPTGRLTIGFKSPRRFSNDDRQFMRMIADSTAYVIENDLLFKQTQDSLEETGILYQAIRAFANAEDKEGILQAIIDYAADPAVDKAMLCLLLTEDWYSTNALMEVVVSWVRGDSVDLTGMRFTSEQFPSWEQIATSEILWVNDVMEEPTLDDTARMGYRALDIASFVIVPLIMANKPFGAILLGSSEARHHSEREIRIYQSLADQAAITMENIRLYEEAERRARQLSTSARVSQAASSILQIDELLPEMVDLIKEAFGYDHVQIFLLNEMGDRAVLKASTGEAGRQLLAINHFLEVGSRSVIGTVTSTGQYAIALDTADARVIHKPNPYLPNTRSEMAIPLLAKGEILGALDVQSNQPGAFTDADVRVLSILADQLAVAIVNASLFELSQRRSEEMGFLFTVAAEATTSAELSGMLQRVSELLLHQMDADLVIPYLYQPSERTLVVSGLATDFAPSELDIPEALSLSTHHVVTQVAMSRMPVIIHEYTYHTEYVAAHSPEIISGIYVPLITGEVMVGVLALESRQLGHFDENTLNLLQALTGSLSAVMQSKLLLDEIQKANERLREIDKLKTNFLAAMSHELRTPLNSVIGFSRVILKGIDGPITDMQRQDLQTIHDSGKHLLGLVNDILDQAKIEAGKMELAREYFDLGDVVKGVMSSAVGLTKEKPIRLYTEIPNELPKGYGDEFRTRQILLNLVSNAAKFTEEGSVTMSVTPVFDNNRPMIRVSVTDTGIGIQEQDFSKLFESFQQVDNSTTRNAEGTGLGLPLAKSLTELQGGRIWVESEYGIGSTFSVTIPTEPDPNQIKAEEDEESASNGNNAPAPALKTIVVLEDNLDLMNLYRRHLSKASYDLIGSLTLDEAKEKVMMIQPTFILVNVDMVDGQGWDYLAELSQFPTQRPIPLISTSIHDEKARSSEMGATMHLVRPFEPEQLLAIIHELEKRAAAS